MFASTWSKAAAPSNRGVANRLAEVDRMLEWVEQERLADLPVLGHETLEPSPLWKSIARHRTVDKEVTSRRW